MVGRLSKRKNRTKPKARAEPTQKRSIAFVMPGDWDTLECMGYTSLAHNPEIVAAVDTIARLIGSMTIHLMENAGDGDVRIKDGLSRKIDINPNEYMTRSSLIYWIVKNLFLDGNGNAVALVQTSTEQSTEYIQSIYPIPPHNVTFLPEGRGYQVIIGGKPYDPNDALLHFALNPSIDYPWKGDGFRVVLSGVANNLKQAARTEKGFMESKWKPSIIVKVDALIEEFASPEGRKKLLDSYASSAEVGEPWLIPSEQFSVEQVKPLTLSDLALSDMVTLDKKTVASILGVPSFVLGVGTFNRDEWNNFINSQIMPLARMIEQELTKKLLISSNRFFRFNSWSLFSYSITELVSAGAEMVDRMALRRNEWRSWVNMPPDPEMNELLALENYVPAEKLGDQKKLIQNGGE